VYPKRAASRPCQRVPITRDASYVTYHIPHAPSRGTDPCMCNYGSLHIITETCNISSPAPWTRSSNPANQRRRPNQRTQAYDHIHTNRATIRSKTYAASRVPSGTTTPPQVQATKSPKAQANPPLTSILGTPNSPNNSSTTRLGP